jgi:hypothetical protein
LIRSVVIGQSAENFVSLRSFDDGSRNRLILGLDNARLRERKLLKEASREIHAG